MLLIILSFDLSSFFTLEHSFFSLINFYLDLTYFILMAFILISRRTGT